MVEAKELREKRRISFWGGIKNNPSMLKNITTLNRVKINLR
jgi:hypothetical protein